MSAEPAASGGAAEGPAAAQTGDTGPVEAEARPVPPRARPLPTWRLTGWASPSHPR